MKKWFFNILEKWDQSRYLLRSFFKKLDWTIWLLIGVVSAVLIAQYFFVVDYPFNDQKHAMIQKTTQQRMDEGDNPFFLCSALIVGFTKVLDWLLPYHRAFIFSCGFSGWLAAVFSLFILYKYLRLGLSETRALISVLFTCLLIPMVLFKTIFYVQPILELGFFICALFFLYQKNYFALNVILALGVLNGQWIYFIPFIFLITFEERWRQGIAFFLSFIAVLVVVNFVTYWISGVAPYQINPVLKSDVFESISEEAKILSALFIFSLTVFALLGFREANAFIKRVLIILPLMVLVVFSIPSYFHPEMLLILLPLLLPLAGLVIPRSTRSSHHH